MLIFKHNTIAKVESHHEFFLNCVFIRPTKTNPMANTDQDKRSSGFGIALVNTKLVATDDVNT